MKTAPLGSTDLSVSEIAFGTAPLGQLFGPVPLEDGVAAVQAAIDHGITLFDTAPYYGDAEERLGIALEGRREQVLVSTKTGRFPGEEFDFSPSRIRASLENSLRLLRTDHVDIFFLHDIDFVNLDDILADSIDTIHQLKAEGKVRAVGTSSYGLTAAKRVIVEAGVDVVLNFAHGTLLDNTMEEALGEVARTNNVELFNAAAVALGALTPGVLTRDAAGFLAPPAVISAARAMTEICQDRGADIAFLANQYAIQRSGALSTVIGTTRLPHLRSAVEAAVTPIDEDLLSEVLQHRPRAADHQWSIGRPENR